jgi:hypothetical protein
VAGVVVLLLTLYIVGATFARRQAGEAVPYEAVAFLLPVLATSVLTALYFRMRRPIAAPVVALPDLVQFTVFPFEPLLTAVAAIRWQQGDNRPVEPMPQTARPVVVLGHDKLDVWAALGDSRSLLSIPTTSIGSILPGTVMTQVSRIPIKDRVRAILVEVTIGREVLELPLPICDTANSTRMATSRAIESTVAWMRTIVNETRVEQDDATEQDR